MGFMAFVDRYPNEINSKLTMRDIMERTIPKKSKSLDFYFKSRAELFSSASNEAQEYKQDNKQEIKNIKELIVE